MFLKKYLATVALPDVETPVPRILSVGSSYVLRMSTAEGVGGEKMSRKGITACENVQ